MVHDSTHRQFRFVTYRILWHRQFFLIDRSLQTTLPILQLILVVLVTPLLPILVIGLLKLSTPKRYVLFSIGILTFVFIYSIPFWFDSAVIIDGPLPPKPKLIAHRGLSDKYPENTLAAFSGVFSSYVSFTLVNAPCRLQCLRRHSDTIVIKNEPDR